MRSPHARPPSLLQPGTGRRGIACDRGCRRKPQDPNAGPASCRTATASDGGGASTARGSGTPTRARASLPSWPPSPIALGGRVVLLELAMPYRVIPGIADFARGGLPAPAATDDRNQWVDGYCWLYCGQQWTRVLWIGPVSVAGARAPMYACGPCIRKLQDQVWQSLLLSDGSAESAQVGVSPDVESSGERGRGKHRASGGFLRRR